MKSRPLLYPGNTPITTLPTTKTAQQDPTPLPKATTDFGLHISAEAQYLFEIDKYLSALNQTEQVKALEYLSYSDDLLQQKAADYFRESQATLNQIFKGQPLLFTNTDEAEKAANLLNEAVPPDEHVVGVIMVNLPSTFRLDGKENYVPARGKGRNDAIMEKFDALKPQIEALLGPQDATTLIQFMDGMLNTAETQLLSADDVIYFHYVVKTAKTTIDFMDIPRDMKSQLTKMVDDSISYQDKNQSQNIKDLIPHLYDSRIGELVRDLYRMGNAAQTFNNQLKDFLNNTKISILDARNPITKLLAENPDLVRFSATKIGEAMSYYQNAYQDLKKILNKEFSEPSKEIEIDQGILTKGTQYAMDVIEQIQQYVTNE